MCQRLSGAPEVHVCLHNPNSMWISWILDREPQMQKRTIPRYPGYWCPDALSQDSASSPCSAGSSRPG